MVELFIKTAEEGLIVQQVLTPLLSQDDTVFFTILIPKVVVQVPQRYLYPRLYVNNSPKQPRENIQHYNGENADEGRENTIMIDLAANDTVKAGVWSSHTDNQYYGSSWFIYRCFL